MWKDIKNLLKNRRERYIIIEDGKPSFVILGFNEYKNLVEDKNNFDKESSKIEKANQEIYNLSFSPNVSEDEKSENKERDENTDKDLKIEDLPF